MGTSGRDAVHREVSGDGTPLVCTHGFGDDRTTWIPLRAALLAQGGWAVTTWDLPGHGRTGPAERVDHYRRDHVVELLAAQATLAGSNTARPVLLGHSLGGFLSLAVAILHPEIVRALVLVATGPGFRDPAARERWNEYARSATADFEVPPEAVGMVLQPDSMVIDRVAEIAVPVLQIVGGRDTRYHAGVAYLDRLLPDVTTVTIDGAGHHVHMTHADEVAEAMRAFLADEVGVHVAP